ncbi:MarR family winged helix-turn-helix transcriptional regulator [Amycolatopsis tolypomycina]|uniref:DNA-binding transcriptional regulator, MarR family n=1 Tax=Amycolatopsis tolypomycina TaxID=208445 RepID=A0A1H4XEX1_9PSEU|nr:MarR family transcriptional regulator [Amycolatopsis tolypomycina]SED03478.1 DNA-binding transcriptional regulator, MarR family [Amycolatopsis tolypomycina]
MSDEEQVRWLDEDERHAWINLAKILLTLPGTLESQLLRDADLTLLGYMILARLSAVPGQSLRMSEIAEMANGSLPRISHAVARLEDRGWVVREVCTGQGRRFTTATLTEAGLAHLTASAPGHVETVRRLVIDPLGEDFLRVGLAVERVLENMGVPTEILKPR